MANMVGRIDKMCGLSKEGMDSRCNHNCFKLSLFASGARIHTIPWTFGYWERFTGKRRLQNKGFIIASVQILNLESKKNLAVYPNIQKWLMIEAMCTTRWSVCNYGYQVQTWSILRGSPSRRRASAGTISPSLMLMMSPGTRIAASCSPHLPSRRTFTDNLTREMRKIH